MNKRDPSNYGKAVAITNSAAQGFWTNASPPMVSEARDIPRIDNNAYKKHSN
jgi:hypothetical protein